MPGPADSIVYEQRIMLYADILGWSDIVRKSESNPEARQTISQVVDQLKREEYFQNLPGTACRMAFVSDSIFLSMSPDDPAAWTTSILLLCNHFNTLLDKYHLHVRGAIVMGPVFHQGSTIVGPGVISAVESERQTVFPRIVIHDSALEFLRDAYQEYAEIQWLNRGPDGVASLNTIDIGFGSNQEGMVDLAGRTIRRVEERLLVDGKDPKLVAKHLWMMAYCQDLLQANAGAFGYRGQFW